MAKKREEHHAYGDFEKDFIRELRRISPSYGERELFKDVVRIFAISFKSAVSVGAEKQRYEDEYQTFVQKFGRDGMEQVSKCLAITIEAISEKRQCFLGHILEALNASEKGFGQYLTPIDVSRLMSRITVEQNPVKGEIVTMSDPASGAGVLLIETAEEFMQNGGRQADIFIDASDIDEAAFCIAYVQFTLLGYPARVTRMNALSMEVYEGPWFTMPFFLHGTEWRLMRQKRGEKEQETTQAEEETKPEEKPEATFTQGELF